MSPPNPAPIMPPYTPPKLSSGQPDIQGIWQVLDTAAWDLQDHGASLGVPAGRGVVVAFQTEEQGAAINFVLKNETVSADSPPAFATR